MSRFGGFRGALSCLCAASAFPAALPRCGFRCILFRPLPAALADAPLSRFGGFRGGLSCLCAASAFPAALPRCGSRHILSRPLPAALAGAPLSRFGGFRGGLSCLCAASAFPAALPRCEFRHILFRSLPAALAGAPVSVRWVSGCVVVSLRSIGFSGRIAAVRVPVHPFPAPSGSSCRRTSSPQSAGAGGRRIEIRKLSARAAGGSAFGTFRKVAAGGAMRVRCGFGLPDCRSLCGLAEPRSVLRYRPCDAVPHGGLHSPGTCALRRRAALVAGDPHEAAGVCGRRELARIFLCFPVSEAYKPIDGVCPRTVGDHLRSCTAVKSCRSQCAAFRVVVGPGLSRTAFGGRGEEREASTGCRR